MGFLDHVYPILLLSDRRLEFDPAGSDDVGEVEITGSSASVSEDETDLHFEAHWAGIPLEFSLPVTIAKSIGHQVETETIEARQNAFSFVDIPVKLVGPTGPYRRIFRLRLNVPSDKRRELLSA